MYTRDEVFKASLEYFNGDELAADVFTDKYCLYNAKDGKFYELTPDDMHRRIAKEFARIEKKYKNPLSEQEIYEYLKNFGKIVPQGSPMAGIGNPFQTVSLSNCYVIDSPYDSYGGILKADQEQAQLMKRRGGVGFDISNIRPKGVATNNAAKTTDGIGVFMERFSNTTREVAQNGRRGALMLTISVHHPEIETFINIKRDRKKVTGANISIRVTDEFMNAVQQDGDFELRWPIEKPVFTKKVKAKDIWEQICQAAWDNAEPGVLFWDNAQRNTPTEFYDEFKSTSTNPCGEIILSPYDSCRLMLLNLMGFLKEAYKTGSDFDLVSFYSAARIGQRLMDDMIDLELECIDKIINKIQADPEPDEVKQSELSLWNKIRQSCVNGRRTGLGITAVGDAIAALGMLYGSEKSIQFTNDVYMALATASYHESVILAEERGAFPAWNLDEKEHPFIKNVISLLPANIQKKYKKFGRRNIANTTTAPAGSVSILTQTTSGIEPVFKAKYERFKKINPTEKNVNVDRIDDTGERWTKYTVYHHGLKKWMEATDNNNFEDSPYFKASSDEIDWSARVALQAAAQKWICHSISSTINLPTDVSLDTVKELYLKAWKFGCKGVTVYRDGSRDGVLVNNNNETKKHDLVYHHAPKRPELLDCEVYRVSIKGEPWTVFVGLYNGKPYEIMGGLSQFINLPKKIKTGLIRKNKKKSEATYDFLYGEDEDQIIIKDLSKVFENPTYGSFTRTISLALRHGTPIQYIVEQLQKGDKESDMFTFSKVIARVLKNKITDGTKVNKTCTECGSDNLAYQQGCISCLNCGWSKCT